MNSSTFFFKTIGNRSEKVNMRGMAAIKKHDHW